MQKQILKLFWLSTSRYKTMRTLSLIFPALAVATNSIIAPYILSIFLNQFQNGTVSMENSLGLVLFYGGLMFVGEVVLWRLALYFCWTFEVNSMRDLYIKIFHKLSNESLNFHADRFGGSLVSQSTKLIGSFERFWDMIIWSIVPMLTVVAGAIIAMSSIGYVNYAVFIAIFAVMFAAAIMISSKFLSGRNTLEAQASNKTSGYLADIVTNAMTVKSFGNEAYEIMQAKSHVDNWHDKSTSLKWGVISATTVYSSLLALINTAALVYAVYAASTGLILVGTAYLILTYSLNVGRQLWEMNNIVRTYSRAIGDAHDMTEILNSPYELNDASTDSLIVKRGLVEFNDVAFTHDDNDGGQVFASFNLTIQPGQRIGVVGRSGSGKTTLTRILLRFSDIQSGSILVDGQNIADVTQQSLHHSIAYVAQEPLLFHRSLRDNITYGSLDASEADITAAITQAHAREFIDKLPAGLDTVVGERGIKLSGGQRQRVAIARAILKDAPILVLDEATSALDSESEHYIQSALQELMKNRTSIVIAHRLSTIAKLDRIVVLDEGKIIEDGTHEQLLKSNKTYAKLWSRQSGGFIEE